MEFRPSLPHHLRLLFRDFFRWHQIRTDLDMTNAQLLFALGVILLGMRDAADADKKSLKSLTTFGIVLFVAAVIAFLEHWPMAST
jgi:hypothetical protein